MGLTKVRYYYSFLTIAEKKVFDSIYIQLYKQQPEIKIVGTLGMAKKILLLVLKDCPELFFVDNTRMQFVSGMGHVTIRMTYTKNPGEIKSINQKLNIISNRFLKEIEKHQLDNQNVIRYVHDFILKNTEYAKENLAMQDVSGDVSTICGVFINKRAVCMGISLAAKWLLDQVGIVSGVIEGRVIDTRYPGTMEYTGGSIQNNHAWNIVNVNDCWHYMDVTMDMGASQDKVSWISYDYFLRNDTNMLKYTQYDNPYVSCSGEKYSYFASKKVVFSKEDVFTKYLTYCLKKKVRRLYFQLEGDLAKKTPEQIQKQISRCILSGFRWRYNQNLCIYDFKLL